MKALKLVDLGDLAKDTKNAVPGGPPDDAYSDLRPDPYCFPCSRVHEDEADIA